MIRKMSLRSPGDSIRYRIRWDAIQNRSESFQNPMKSDRNPGGDPTDGTTVLDPIASYSKIR